VAQTTTRPPAAPPSDEDVAIRRSRRRWLWWLLAGVLALVLALTSTGIVLVSNYQPFRPGYKQYGPPPGVEPEVVRVDWLGLAPNLRVFRISPHDGLTFRYRFSIWNHGPVPITVTQFGVPASEQAGEGVTIVPVALYPDVNNIPELGGKWVPVQPLRLEPRQMMGVEMQVTVTSCEVTSARWNGIPLTFELYGIERHVDAPSNVQFDLVGPQEDC
jgi:hypothetical protein